MEQIIAFFAIWLVPGALFLSLVIMLLSMRRAHKDRLNKESEESRYGDGL